MNIDDPGIGDSDMLESLSFSVLGQWGKRGLNINTYFSVTGWMLCVIPHIRKYAKDNSDGDNRKQFNNVIKTFFIIYLRMNCMLPQACFGVGILTLITIMFHLIVKILSGKEKPSFMVICICGIRSIHFFTPRFFVLQNVDLNKRFLVL